MLIAAMSRSIVHYTEDSYPFDAIWINGRQVSIEKILSQPEQCFSSFEKNTFHFIRSWLSGDQNFQVATSGSTGEPKVISISRSQMISSAMRTAAKIGLQKNSTALVCIDTKYIGGKMMLARCLSLGLRIMAIDPMANPLVRLPVDKCVQFTALVPYQIQSILESKHPHLLNSFDAVLIGGAALSASIADQLDNFQVHCYETYGMTETISHVGLRLVNGKMKQPYFEALPGVEVSKDNRGCLVVAADFLNEPVITNDLVDIPDPGKFVWMGRADRIINSGGVKVVPEKIEATLQGIFEAHKIHNRFFIAALPDERLGNKIVLILEGVQFSSELLNPSVEALKSAVSPYEFPKEVFTIPSFVYTGSQKIDRIQSLPRAVFYASLK